MSVPEATVYEIEFCFPLENKLCSLKFEYMNIIYVWLALRNMLSGGNGIVVEPSALGMAAKSTKIGNFSING